MSPFDKKEAAELTEADKKDVEKAWHDARTDDQLSETPSVDYGDRRPTHSDDLDED